MQKNSGIFARARFSLSGLVRAWRYERSFRVQQLAAAALLLLAVALRFDATQWCLVLLAVALSTAMELANAALETALDRLHPGFDPAIGQAKDLASAAAFVCNCVMVLIGATLVLGTVLD